MLPRAFIIRARSRGAIAVTTPPKKNIYQLKPAGIDEETYLIKIALLPDSISGRVKNMIASLEELIKGKDIGDDGGDGPKRLKKIKLLPSPKRIKSLTEWTGPKNELDTRISTALDQGDKVELS